MAVEGQNLRAVKLRKRIGARRQLSQIVKVRKPPVGPLVRKKTAARSKIAKLEKRLEEERAKNALLVDEMNKMRDQNEDADTTHDKPTLGSAELDVQSTVEIEAIGPSSTRHPKDAPGLEESKFMSSINQLSVSSINIPECKSTEDGEISRHTFEQWRDLLIDSLQLAGINDEVTKFTIFKVKAGPRLLEVYRNAKADVGGPDAILFPFGHAMYRLKAYFGSGNRFSYKLQKIALG